MDSEEFHPVTTLITMVVSFGGFLLMPVSAFLLWSENRTLAWIAIISTVLGLHPLIGFPVGIGFVTYALTEDVPYSVGATVIALVAAFGLPMLIEYLAERRPAPHGNDAFREDETNFSNEVSRTCPACRMVSDPGDRYCQFCGSPLFVTSAGTELPTTAKSGGRNLKLAALAVVVVVGLLVAGTYRNYQDRENGSPHDEAVPTLLVGVTTVADLGPLSTRLSKPVVDLDAEPTVTPQPLSGQGCLTLLNWYNASVLRYNEAVQRQSGIDLDTISAAGVQKEINYLRDLLQQQRAATPPERGRELQAAWLEYYQTYIDIWIAAANGDSKPPITVEELQAMQTELFDQMEDARTACA